MGEYDSKARQGSGLAVAAVVQISSMTQTTTKYTAADLNQQDLDRDFCLPLAQVLKWMQAARMGMAWVGPGYSALSQEKPPMLRRLVVRTQMINMVPDALSKAAGRDVHTVCEVGVIGKSSIEFKYKIRYDDECVGTGVVNMVNVAGEPGSLKSSPVPARVKALAAQTESDDRKLMSSIMKAMPADAPSSAFIYSTSIRYSDEDINKHANHASYARFFEDAFRTLEQSTHPLAATAQAKQITGVVVDYAKEAAVNDVVQVCLSSRDGSLDVHLYRMAANHDSERELCVRGHLLLLDGKAESQFQKSRL